MTFPDGLSLETVAHYSFGAAVAPDGGVWFTEFNRQRVRRLDPATGRVETIWSDLPGAYGIAVDPAGRVFVGQDLGDRDHPGQVVRLDPTTGARRIVVERLTRPRQLACDREGVCYVVCEAGAAITGGSPAVLRWSPARGGEVRVWMDGLETPQGIAAGDGGAVWVSTYGSPGRAPGKVLARGRDGQVTTLAQGFWRARGLARTRDALLLVTEANEEDQGNSGLLARIDARTGVVSRLLDDLDYPQFGAVDRAGGLWFAANRDTRLCRWRAPGSVARRPVPEIPGASVSVRGGVWGRGGDAPELTLTVAGIALRGRVRRSHPHQSVEGWVHVPAARLALPRDELYTDRGDPEHPQPGLFALPSVRARAASGRVRIDTVCVRGRHGKRWPMTGVGTKDEAPPPGFDERPTAYRIWFRWDAR